MSEKLMRENLMVIAHTLASSKGWALATLSKRIHGNQGVLERFASGKSSVTIRSYYDMVNKMREMWPEGLPWPITAELPKLGKKSD